MVNTKIGPLWPGEKCFGDAILRGEDVPVVNVTDILSSILDDAFAYARTRGVSAPENMSAGESATVFYHVDDRVTATCRNLVFNLTNPALKHLTQSQRDDVGLSYFHDNFVLDRSSTEAKLFFSLVEHELKRSSKSKSNSVAVGAYYLLYLIHQVYTPTTSFFELYIYRLRC
ncbi:hypothetical protein [Candidatus Ichthyocystis hellenicum]|uniref:hypothetical protein n=1 Tax=Candidatus Ichthyocystis hellenicum TaxID=1561003 RepID=UPI000B856017|nr:hypothetical protein [Candidatus Ichthyocystis hellenicum]